MGTNPVRLRNAAWNTEKSNIALHVKIIHVTDTRA